MWHLLYSSTVRKSMGKVGGWESPSGIASRLYNCRTVISWCIEAHAIVWLVIFGSKYFIIYTLITLKTNNKIKVTTSATTTTDIIKQSILFLAEVEYLSA